MLSRLTYPLSSDTRDKGTLNDFFLMKGMIGSMGPWFGFVIALLLWWERRRTISARQFLSDKTRRSRALCLSAPMLAWPLISGSFNCLVGIFQTVALPLLAVDKAKIHGDRKTLPGGNRVLSRMSQMLYGEVKVVSSQRGKAKGPPRKIFL